MRISINAFWVYGFFVIDLGDLKVENYKTFIYIDDKKYPSPYMAMVELSTSLWKSGYKGNVEIKQFGCEEMIACKIEGEIGRLNYTPAEEVLQRAEKELSEVVAKLGLKKEPKPKLYFMVECE